MTSVFIKAFLFITFVIFCVTSCASQKDMVYLNKQLNALYRQTKDDRERIGKAIKGLEQALKAHEAEQKKLLEEAISEQESWQSELEEIIRAQESRQSELEEIVRTNKVEQEAKRKKLEEAVKAKEVEQEAKQVEQEEKQKKLEEAVKAKQIEQEAKREEVIRALKKDQEFLRTTIAQIEADFLGVKENIRVLTGRIEESNHLLKGVIEKDTTRTDAMASQMKELSFFTEDLISRLESLENYVSAEIEAKKERARLKKILPPQEIRETERPVPQERKPTESELYDRSLGYYRDGQHEKAMADFNNFLKLFPRSQLADNAHFWIGECYRSQKKYEKAILAYQKVIDGYPEGNKVPIAMLHQGFAFEKINDRTTAKLVFKKLVKNFPKTKEAEIARKRIK